MIAVLKIILHLIQENRGVYVANSQIFQWVTVLKSPKDREIIVFNFLLQDNRRRNKLSCGGSFDT